MDFWASSGVANAKGSFPAAETPNRIPPLKSGFAVNFVGMFQCLGVVNGRGRCYAFLAYLASVTRVDLCLPPASSPYIVTLMGNGVILSFEFFFRRTCVFPYFLLPVVKCEKKSRMKTVAQKNFLTPPPLSANIFSPAQQSPLRSLVN